MKAEQIEQMKSSFERMFPIACQSRMLMSTLGSADTGLALLEHLAPVLAQMGARQAEYGVKKMHYAAVGAALFWTLEQGLGYYYFTPDVRWAWAAAFELLSSTLQAGVRHATR